MIGESGPELAALRTYFTTVESRRDGAHATYNGGHHDEACRLAFHHGMDTAYNIQAAYAQSALGRLDTIGAALRAERAKVESNAKIIGTLQHTLAVERVRAEQAEDHLVEARCAKAGAVARAEKAERERDEARRQAAQLRDDLSLEVANGTQYIRERDEARFDRDEHKAQLAALTRERDEASRTLADVRASLVREVEARKAAERERYRIMSNAYKQTVMRAERAESIVARLRNPPEGMLAALRYVTAASPMAIIDKGEPMLTAILRTAADWTPPAEQPTPSAGTSEQTKRLDVGYKIRDTHATEDTMMHQETVWGHLVELSRRLDAIEGKGKPSP